MELSNSANGWGAVARLLHWAMAAIIIFMLGVGFYMVRIVGDDLIARFELTQLHKSWGFVVFVLALARIVWRWRNTTPALPEGMPAWQKSASHASHVALYILMVALPLSGWLMASASPYNDPDAYVYVPNMVFGLFEMPDPYPVGSEALTDQLKRFHLGFALALTALLGLHVAAALKHQFVDRDGLLRRMISGVPSE